MPHSTCPTHYCMPRQEHHLGDGAQSPDCEQCRGDYHVHVQSLAQLLGYMLFHEPPPVK